MTKKRWVIAPPAPADFRRTYPEIPGVLLELLYQRGLQTQPAIDEFLNPDYGSDVHDPFLFSHMQRAADRILAAIAREERIMVYGDYDADGVCGAALLVSTLEALGAKPGIYLPFRETEGYGLNAGAANEIIEQGFGVVVSVDCGITNRDEVGRLQAKGVDVIITDHHNPPDTLPAAFAILNPKVAGDTYPYRQLCGTGVAFKLSQALLAESSRQRHPKLKFPPDGFEKWLLDLVAIGTVADMVELLGENRTLVHYGLTVLRKSRCLGLRALVSAAGVDIAAVAADTIGFALAPRLNAAGRMNHASAAYKLLVSNDPAEVRRLSGELNEQNRQRQALTESIRQAARSQVMPVGKRKLLFAFGEQWAVGVVGLVAGRLADEFGRPAVVVGKTADGSLVGSGRSVAGFNITEALQECTAHLSRFGGHFYACGFTVKSEPDLSAFQKRMEDLAAAAFTDQEVAAVLPIDAEIDLAEATFALLEQLQRLEPYGQGNPRPRFVSRGLTVSAVSPVGTSGRHLRVMVSQHGRPEVAKLIGFSIIGRIPKIVAGDTVDVVFEIGENVWNGNRELQLKIVDLEKVN